MSILQVLRLKFRKFRISEILNIKIQTKIETFSFDVDNGSDQNLDL